MTLAEALTGKIKSSRQRKKVADENKKLASHKRVRDASPIPDGGYGLAKRTRGAEEDSDEDDENERFPFEDDDNTEFERNEYPFFRLSLCFMLTNRLFFMIFRYYTATGMPKFKRPQRMRLMHPLGLSHVFWGPKDVLDASSFEFKACFVLFLPDHSHRAPMSTMLRTQTTRQNTSFFWLI